DGLEVVVQLISSDAVQVKVGDPVIIDDWGGDVPLPGKVRRIDPFAITKFSALGVEEQRVPVTISLTGPAEDRSALGHGYRVEARIVVWQAEDAVRVPSSALFRSGEERAVFVVRDGVAVKQPVEIGRNNGTLAEVRHGLQLGDRVILYPSAAVLDGTRVQQRKVE
uniref:efflux RND transporter periplasmic adaptor subunit n=1 Tax=Phaeovulum sp. TaxID=2934796 RepID=UPI00356430BC